MRWPRTTAVALLATLPAAWLFLAWAPARARRGADFEVAQRLPAPDLALAGGARQLRMPSLEEPWAPFQDSPGLLDVDPAGALLLPRPLHESAPANAESTP